MLGIKIASCYKLDNYSLKIKSQINCIKNFIIYLEKLTT